MVFLYNNNNKILSSVDYKNFHIKRFNSLSVSNRENSKGLTSSNRKFLKSLGFKLKA
jgi:hypothetical protein